MKESYICKEIALVSKAVTNEVPLTVAGSLSTRWGGGGVGGGGTSSWLAGAIFSSCGLSSVHIWAVISKKSHSKAHHGWDELSGRGGDLTSQLGLAWSLTQERDQPKKAGSPKTTLKR